jgi:putative oxidoreductase
MQRLYSTFPNSSPGVALLLMRLGQSVQVLWGDDLRSLTATDPFVALLHGLEFLTSGLLAIGLWTPIAGSLQALLECPSVYSHGHFERDHFLGVLLCVCLAMLGPGAWSLDARLFGRQRIRIDRLED